MFGGNAIEPRDEFVDAWVVFHGAGAERIHAEVDGVVPGGESGEVADDFDLADFGEAFDAFAAIAGTSDFAGSAVGTSSGGSSNARLPGEDFSKIKPSF